MRIDITDLTDRFDVVLDTVGNLAGGPRRGDLLLWRLGGIRR
jgi:hypothetical protein